MKTITINSIKKARGFARRVEFDFKDDGNSFTGWSYRGLPITQLRSDGQTYFCFRVDYLNEHSSVPVKFTWYDWMQTEGYKMADKWNGVDELPTTMDEIASVGDKIISCIEELNAKVEKEEVSVGPIISKLLEEECYFAKEYAKITLVDLFDERLSEYDVKILRDYSKSIYAYCKQAQKMRVDIKAGKFSKKSLKELSQKLDKYGYVSNNASDCYYVKRCYEIINEKLNQAS